MGLPRPRLQVVRPQLQEARQAAEALGELRP